MSVKNTTSLYLPSIEELVNANAGSLIYFDSNNRMKITNNFTIEPANASTLQLTASNAIYITGSTAQSVQGSSGIFTSTTGKIFVSGSFDTRSSTYYNNVANNTDSRIQLQTDLIGIENQEISGSWIYNHPNSTEDDQIIRKNPNKSLDFSIRVGTNDLGEQYFQLEDFEVQSAFSSNSQSDHSIIYIDNNWTNDPNNLSNVVTLSNPNSRDIFVHPKTRLIIFDTNQQFYTPNKCRIYLAQTKEAAEYYSYSPDSSAQDFVKYDGSKIQFMFRRIPFLMTSFTAGKSGNTNAFRVSFEGTTSSPRILQVPFKKGIISEYIKDSTAKWQSNYPAIGYDKNYIEGFNTTYGLSYNPGPGSNYFTYYAFHSWINQYTGSGANTRKYYNLTKDVVDKTTGEVKKILLLQKGNIFQADRDYEPNPDTVSSGIITPYLTNSWTMIFRYCGSNDYKYFIDYDLL